ncbi:hypothetical protein CDAR_256271 [Caerostris darwini]|uniref:Uncharacterized protein n=1 Tax=Caerostris darwini TaxID=1538125 RepID=A0AAV4TT01_9ARAC|nr:hypothetical protein CDAR_256271 [Caerostris darwini]
MLHKGEGSAHVDGIPPTLTGDYGQSRCTVVLGSAPFIVLETIDIICSSTFLAELYELMFSPLNLFSGKI